MNKEHISYINYWEFQIQNMIEKFGVKITIKKIASFNLNRSDLRDVRYVLLNNYDDNLLSKFETYLILK